MIGKGPSARSIRIDLPPFTLVGATTRAGSLSAPLRDRFGVLCRLEYYTPEQLKQIVLRTAAILDTQIEDLAAREISLRSRGTPRIANRLLRRVRDFAQVKGNGNISLDLTNNALNLMHVDHLGLDHIDHKLLKAIIEKFKGGPVGLETIAATIGEEAGTIEDVYEPYLLQIGFIQRTPRGRIVTNAVYEHFQLEYQKMTGMGKLFMVIKRDYLSRWIIDAVYENWPVTWGYYY